MLFKKWKEKRNHLENSSNTETKNEPTLGTETQEFPTLKRLYVISRDNIKLEDAQEIVWDACHKSIYHAQLLSQNVPLVWCAAYPDEMFGEIPLKDLLLVYAEKQEGDRYLNKNSMVVPVEGKYKGYDYYLIALV